MAAVLAGMFGARPAGAVNGGTITGNLAITGTLSVTGVTTMSAQLLLANAGWGWTADPASGFVRSSNTTCWIEDSEVIARSHATGSNGLVVPLNLISEPSSTKGFQTHGLENLITTAANSKTADYLCSGLGSESLLIFDGTDLTCTLDATPTAGQRIRIVNKNATALIVARNGNTISGLSQNLSIPQNGSVTLIQHEAANYLVVSMVGNVTYV